MAKPIKSLELHYSMIQFLIMEDITWPSGDAKFIVSRVSATKINSVPPGDHVIFFLLYKMFTIHNDVCGAIFSKISDHFPKVLDDFPKFVWQEVQKNVSQHFPKITEDYKIIILKYS